MIRRLQGTDRMQRKETSVVNIFHAASTSERKSHTSIVPRRRSEVQGFELSGERSQGHMVRLSLKTAFQECGLNSSYRQFWHREGKVSKQPTSTIIRCVREGDAVPIVNMKTGIMCGDRCRRECWEGKVVHLGLDDLRCASSAHCRFGSLSSYRNDSCGMS